MSKFNKLQSAFTAGEVSDKFKGRSDAQEYHQGCDKLENFIVQRQGGALKRPGTRFVAETYTQSNTDQTKIIPFVYSKTESYVVTFYRYELNGENFWDVNIHNADGTSCDVRRSLYQWHGIGDLNEIKFAQTGGTLIVCPSDSAYSEPGFHDNNYFYRKVAGAPILVLRLEENLFQINVLAAPINNTTEYVPGFPNVGLPDGFRYNHSLFVPYLSPNTDKRKRLKVDVLSGRGTLSCVDDSGAPNPIFTPGHTGTALEPPANFKLTASGVTGVFVCDNNLLESNYMYGKTHVMSANPLGTVINLTAHGFETKDKVHLSIAEGPQSGDGPSFTTPTFAGTFEDPVRDLVTHTGIVNPAFNEYSIGSAYVHKIDADSFRLHPTRDLSVAGNINEAYSLNSAGDLTVYFDGMEMSTINGYVEVAPHNTSYTDDWQESAWSKHQGFPRSVAFHEQRAVYGGNYRNPDTIWLSQLGNIVNMMALHLDQHNSFDTAIDVTQAASRLGFLLYEINKELDPTSFNISSKQANIIQWIESNRNVLTIGTTGSEYIATGGDVPLSANSVSIQKQTDYGSMSAQAIAAGPSILFVGRPGRYLRDFKYNRNNGSYVSVNLNTMADHITYRGFDGLASSTLKGIEIVEMSYLTGRDTVWCRTSSNQLISVTLSKEANITAWAYHPMSRDVMGLTTSPSANGIVDELWLSLKDASGRYFLEKIVDDFDHDFLANTSTDENDYPMFSDSSIRIVLDSATNTVNLPINANLDASLVPTESHLEGKTVNVLAGTAIEKGLVVAGNTLTLGATYPAGTALYIGLPYTARLRTLDIEAGGDFGSAQGARQRIDRIAARLYRSQGGTYGNPDATKVPFEYEDAEVFTGIKRLDFDITPDMEMQVEIEHDDPTPFGVMSLTYRGVSYD